MRYFPLSQVSACVKIIQNTGSIISRSERPGIDAVVVVVIVARSPLGYRSTIVRSMLHMGDIVLL